jgi:predicted transcriptional regulator
MDVYISVNGKEYVMSEVISVRVPKEVKRELEAAGINTSEEVKHHLEELAWKMKCKRAVEEMSEVIRKRVKPSRRGFATAQIREDRDGHN